MEPAPQLVVSRKSDDPSMDAKHLPMEALRGLLAGLVLCYHAYYNQGFANLAPASFFAVYGFFVISGFALTLTYFGRLNSIDDLGQFLWRRFVRLWPLYVLTMLLTLGMSSSWPADVWERGFANATLTFGFVNPGATSLVGGGWSIGIEVVFYLIFPFILWAAERAPRALAVASIAALLFAQVRIETIFPGAPVMTTELWTRYTQPGQFVGYFMAGCVMAAMFRGHRAKQDVRPAGALLASIALGVIAACVVALCWPLSRAIDALQLPLGGLFVILTLAAVGAACFLPQPHGLGRSLCIWLGRLSYGLYLLHSLVLTLLPAETLNLGSPHLVVLVQFAVSAGLAAVLFTLFEEPLRRRGRDGVRAKPAKAIA